jgi:virulence-associated protein VagC
LTIQILQSGTVLILEPVNPEGSDDILDTATGVCAATALNATLIPLPLPQPEDIPPPPPSHHAFPPPEANKVLMNLVNVLCQQSDRLERVEKN